MDQIIPVSWIAFTCSPVSRSHSRNQPESPPLRRCLPSGRKARAKSPSCCPCVQERSSLPVSTSHSFRLPPSTADTARRPSGEKTTAVSNHPFCLLQTSLPLLRSHRRNVVSPLGKPPAVRA